MGRFELIAMLTILLLPAVFLVVEWVRGDMIAASICVVGVAICGGVMQGSRSPRPRA